MHLSRLRPQRSTTKPFYCQQLRRSRSSTLFYNVGSGTPATGGIPDNVVGRWYLCIKFVGYYITLERIMIMEKTRDYDLIMERARSHDFCDARLVHHYG